MPEFSSLNGYTVKDETARNIAKGRNQAVAFGDYASMITALNAMEKGEYKTGQNIYIGVVGVPDLWVYSVENIVHNFSYVSDEDVVEKLTANTTIQAGYYKLAMLEGQKVDLTTYDEKLAEHTEDISELNENMGGCVFSCDANGAYVEYTANGSTVKKKLGEPQVIGTTSSKTQTFDLSEYSGYNSFTNDNFLFIPQNTSGGRKDYSASSGAVSVYPDYIFSYNYDAPNLTVSSYTKARVSGHASGSHTTVVPIKIFLC